jgi:hypothetical protein
VTPRGRKAEDLSGRRFGRVVALARVGTGIATRSALWECRCDCGVGVVLQAAQLKSQRDPSCAECAPETSGFTSDSAYTCWRAMIARCEDPATNGFESYGGRGIRVCAKWRRSFGAFLSDVGSRPSHLHTLGRIDNDGHYEPGNVRWETRREQATNRCTNLMLTYKGETLPLVVWCERLGISYERTHARVRAGWSTETAFERPARRPRPPQKAKHMMLKTERGWRRAVINGVPREMFSGRR